jgi:sulfatase modifying factor 1
MHGNVFEWCHDSFGSYYYKQSPANDPQGPATENLSSFRVLRGGSWDFDARHARSAFRRRGVADGRSSNRGFRLVRELD